MLILNETMIGNAIEYKELTNCIEKAFIHYEDQKCLIPERFHLNFGNNTLLVMPAYEPTHFCTKLVTVNPENNKKGKTSIHGTVILNDSETGQPIALMNGATVTAARTGAIGSVAVRHLGKDYGDTLGIIGLGTQGFYQALFVSEEKKFRKVVIWDKNTERLIEFTSLLKAILPYTEIETVTKVEHLLEMSNIVICATTSDKPVLPDNEQLIKDKLYIGVGSFKPNMREFPDALPKLCSQIIIDTETAIHESGDIAYPIEHNLIERDNIIPFGKLLKNPKLLDNNKTRFFKTVGMAVFDLYAAKYIYAMAIKNGHGFTLNL
ncbi:MAG: ornithine cyclodeaminase family protein [Hyphomicrobiales bacterium]